METFEIELKGEHKGFSKQQVEDWLRKIHPNFKIKVKEKDE